MSNLASADVITRRPFIHDICNGNASSHNFSLEDGIYDSGPQNTNICGSKRDHLLTKTNGSQNQLEYSVSCHAPVANPFKQCLSLNGQNEMKDVSVFQNIDSDDRNVFGTYSLNPHGYIRPRICDDNDIEVSFDLVLYRNPMEPFKIQSGIFRLVYFSGEEDGSSKKRELS